MIFLPLGDELRSETRSDARAAKGWVTRARGDEALAASERALAGVSGAGAGVTGSTAEAGVIESQRPQLMAAVQAAEAGRLIGQQLVLARL